MTVINTYSNVSSLAQNIQEDAIFVIREEGQMLKLVKSFNEMTGLNPRVGYVYNELTARTIGEADDLTGSAFAPSADQTLTPAEIGLQIVLTDSRMASDLPENIRNDSALEMGYAALDKIESDLVGNLSSLTAGTVGAAGTTITWGYVSAAISQARNANKSAMKPLAAVIHGFQAAVLAKSASIAGATSLAQAPAYTDMVTSQGLKQVFTFMDVPIYQSFQDPDSADDFTGGVFPMEAIAIDWRSPIRIEPERDASRRAWELNMSATYAHGVWRPARGVQMIFDATAPTS